MDKTQMIAHGVTAVVIVALGVYTQKQISSLNEKIKQLETLISKIEPSRDNTSPNTDALENTFKKSHDWSVNNFKAIKDTFTQQNTEISKLKDEIYQIKQTLGQITQSLQSLGKYQSDSQQELQSLKSYVTSVRSSPKVDIPIPTSSGQKVTFNLQEDDAFKDFDIGTEESAATLGTAKPVPTSTPISGPN